MKSIESKKILILGQTPPPYYGQSMMLSRFIKAKHTHLQVYHVRMAFSKTTKSVGRFSFHKLIHLIQIVIRVVFLHFRHGIRGFYYLPAGPNTIPVLRDIVILSIVRPFFEHTIFHFRAAGLSEYLDQSNFLFKKIATWAYQKPKLAIHLAHGNPRDGQYLAAKKVSVIANGLEDSALNYLPIKRADNGILNILFVGVLSKSKGVMDLLKAVELASHKIRLTCTFLGEWKSDSFCQEAKSFCEMNKLDNLIDFKGEVLGEEKWEYFLNSDVLCFPTYYESESFGNVILEAMMFQLPVISTNWRGIPNLIDDCETGYLLEIKAHTSIAKNLIFLSKNPKIRIQMGKKGRVKYLEKFTLENHLRLMEKNIFETID